MDNSLPLTILPRPRSMYRWLFLFQLVLVLASSSGLSQTDRERAGKSVRSLVGS